MGSFVSPCHALALRRFVYPVFRVASPPSATDNSPFFFLPGTATRCNGTAYVFELQHRSSEHHMVSIYNRWKPSSSKQQIIPTLFEVYVGGWRWSWLLQFVTGFVVPIIWAWRADRCEKYLFSQRWSLLRFALEVWKPCARSIRVRYWKQVEREHIS